MITRVIEVSRIVTDSGIRCGACNKYLAERATRPWRIVCPRCGHTNQGRTNDEAPATDEAPAKPQHAPKRRRRRLWSAAAAEA